MENLLEAYRQHRVILFVGAGVSMNLGLPSWNQLVCEIAKQLNYDPSIYQTLGNNYALAEYYLIKMGHIGKLRSWMDIEWHNPNIDIKNSKVHELIVKADFPILYTTNYDRWLERSYDYYGKNYMKISSAADITKLKDGTTQIIKFHGDFDDDDSIVLGESSYFNRLDFENPLDIKLRSDVLGKSVLFIGYGLSDINIRFLFYKLTKLWEKSGSDSLRPNSYFFSPTPNAIQETILGKWGINMISSEIDEPGEALRVFLKHFV